MGTSQALAGTNAREEFYLEFDWCLDPVPRLRDLLRHLGKELERYETRRDDWEREEHRINLYLLACGIACTLDDYLAGQPWRLGDVAARFAGLRLPLKAAEAVLNFPHRLRARFLEAGLVRWRRQWTECVDAACDLLLGGDEPRFAELARRQLSSAAFPAEALERRMRIPEGYRCQDLTHHDACAMAEKARGGLPDKHGPVLVVGPRTAGGYFAPLAAAWLRRAGYTRARWVTVRPRTGLSAAERRAIAGAASSGSAFLVIDDHQNTGRTLRLLIAALRDLGAKPDRITVAIPAHPARPNWALSDSIARDVRLVVLPAGERHKVSLLDSDWAKSVLKELFGPAIEIRESRETAAVNAALEAHFGDGFQARLKRVFDVWGEGTRVQRVVAKSVGWGWLGYHAWIAGLRLGEFVPRPLALRDGILVSEWLEGAALEPGCAEQDRVAGALGAYLAARVRRLPLDGDPGIDSPAYRWCGWDDLAAALRGVYGRYTGRLKDRAIRKRLRLCATPRPALVDGSMKPADWIRAGSTLRKTDYEQHNFGGGESDLVDPAWDLAAAIFEFDLSEEAERRLMDSYVGESGDAGVATRLPLHKILYAIVAQRAAAYWIGRTPAGERAQECNRRYNAALDFATFHLARHCGRALASLSAEWTPHLFFLDLDGVLDWSFFGFPHTTWKGVRALGLLREAGFSVVLNTARNLAHVREYCRAYRLPGGIAELGSVFWDATREQPLLLIDPATTEQLARAREAVQKLPGVFVDPGNVASVRAYRFAGGRTRPVKTEEVRAALENAGCSMLAVSQSAADTFITKSGIDKGSALAHLRAHLGSSSQPVAAMGDSDRDVPMLAAADLAYAPANASRGVRELIRRGECRQMKGRLQSGLVEAALELAEGKGCDRQFVSDADSLIDALLSVPDRGKLERMLSAFRLGAL